MSSLKTAIEILYSAFSKYTTEGMHYCDCGCIDEENVKKLNAKQLRELEEDDLIPYHGSALYTWGDIQHYKHYLPRILELRSRNRNFAFIDLDEIFVKLNYAKWTEWDSNEINAITDYVLTDWIEFCNREHSEIAEIELKAYGKFFGIKELLRLWDISNAHTALRNFVLFFYNHGNQILNGGLKLKDKHDEDAFISMINSKKIIPKLEEEFFKYELSDKEYAEKISIVLQMIEQEIKIKKDQ